MTTSISTQITSGTEISSQKRGCLFYIKRGMKWFCIVLVALVLMGVSYQAIGVELDKRNYPPRGELYTVNRHQMHMVCVGEGSPTVILQAGGVAESLWWYWVQNQLAEHTRVCAFDRPGLGWSEPVSRPREPLTIVDELHALLAEAGVQPPYVMAGHSYGAFLTRIYAAQYPQEVAGVALVDTYVVGMHPEDFSSKSEVDALIAEYDWLRILNSALARSGLLWLANQGEFHEAGYPPDVARELTALQLRSEVMDADFAEKVTALWALIETSDAADNLGDLPVAFLWGSLSDMTQERNATLLEETTTYSSNSVTRVIEGANHLSILGMEQYAQQVSDTILDVIEAAQTGEPLAQ